MAKQTAATAGLPLPPTTGERIRYAREFLRHWSTDQLVAATTTTGYMVAKHTIHRIERGDRRADFVELVALAEALGVKPEALIADPQEYPEIKVLSRAQDDMTELVRRIRWNGLARGHLRLLPQPNG